MTAEITDIGVAQCEAEPRGKNGLEGYDLNERYLFQRVINAKGKYVRVYPCAGDDYYETCGVSVFKGFFSVVQEYPTNKELA